MLVHFFFNMIFKLNFKMCCNLFNKQNLFFQRTTFFINNSQYLDTSRSICIETSVIHLINRYEIWMLIWPCIIMKKRLQNALSFTLVPNHIFLIRVQVNSHTCCPQNFLSSSNLVMFPLLKANSKCTTQSLSVGFKDSKIGCAS